MRLLIAMLAVTCGVSIGAMAQTQPAPAKTPAETPKQEREMRREEREKEREAKQAQFENYIDSVVMTHDFRFLPQDFQMQPAGRLRQISNPNFRIGIYPTYVDICVPYFVGMTPPYAITIMNYTVPNPSKMLYVQKKDNKGWDISFETNLYSSNNYRFKFSIEGQTGECTLDIESDFLNTVTYTGTILGNN